MAAFTGFRTPLKPRWWFFLTAATDSALTNINAMSRISLRCEHSTSEKLPDRRQLHASPLSLSPSPSLPATHA
jgi:hypothetical protein